MPRQQLRIAGLSSHSPGCPVFLSLGLGALPFLLLVRQVPIYLFTRSIHHVFCSCVVVSPGGQPASSEFPGHSALSGCVASGLRARTQLELLEVAQRKVKSPIFQCGPELSVLLLLIPALFRHSTSRVLCRVGVPGTAFTGYSHSCSTSRGPGSGSRSTSISGSSSGTESLSHSCGIRNGGSKGTSDWSYWSHRGLRT